MSIKMAHKGLIIFGVIAIILIVLIGAVLAFVFGSKKIRETPPGFNQKDETPAKFKPPGGTVTALKPNQDSVDLSEMIEAGTTGKLFSNIKDIPGAGNTVSVGQYIIAPAQPSNDRRGIAMNTNGVYMISGSKVLKQIFVPEKSLSSLAYFKILNDGNIGVYDVQTAEKSTFEDYKMKWNSADGKNGNSAAQFNPTYKPPTGDGNKYFLSILSENIEIRKGTTEPNVNNTGVNILIN